MPESLALGWWEQFLVAGLTCWLLPHWLHQLLELCRTGWGVFGIDVRQVLLGIVLVVLMNQVLIFIYSSINNLRILHRGSRPSRRNWSSRFLLLLREVVVAGRPRLTYGGGALIQASKCIYRWFWFLHAVGLIRPNQWFVLASPTRI